MAEPGGRGRGRGRARARGGRAGGRREHHLIWGGPQGPDMFPHPLEDFPLEGKDDFVGDRKLRPYDDRTEVWPQCRCGEYCVVQVFDEFIDGGRRFYRCPFGYVCAPLTLSPLSYGITKIVSERRYICL